MAKSTHRHKQKNWQTQKQTHTHTHTHSWGRKDSLLSSLYEVYILFLCSMATITHWKLYRALKQEEEKATLMPSFRTLKLDYLGKSCLFELFRDFTIQFKSQIYRWVYLYHLNSNCTMTLWFMSMANLMNECKNAKDRQHKFPKVEFSPRPFFSPSCPEKTFIFLQSHPLGTLGPARHASLKTPYLFPGQDLN